MAPEEFPLSRRVKGLKPSPTLAVDAKAKAMKAQGVDIVNLSAGEPDFDTPAHIKAAAVEAIQRGFTKYTPVGGIPELKRAVAAKMERDYGVSYGDDEICVSTGGKQALYNIFQAILDPGDEVIIPVPYWVSYPAMVELAGGAPILVKTSMDQGFALKVEALEAAITPRTKALILNSPSNPTGAVYPPDLLRELAALAVERRFYIVSDDIYDEIRFDGRRPYNAVSVAPEAREWVLCVNGVSKTYAMTGWRIGYLAGNREVVKAVTKIQSQSTSNPNSVAQKAAVAALTGPQGCVEEMREAFRARRDYMVERLRAMEGVRCVEPQGAFYLFADLSALFGRRWSQGSIDGSLALADYLLEEARVAAVPGIAFGDDRFMRFSYATDLEVIREGMDRLERAIAALER